MSRDYGQYCGLARALDVVGDRWNLLIVRQLLVGPPRNPPWSGRVRP
ncbi:winged helix-turn-helix transcriptional regulator, partial [Mycolicibacterium sphagni]